MLGWPLNWVRTPSDWWKQQTWNQTIEYHLWESHQGHMADLEWSAEFWPTAASFQWVPEQGWRSYFLRDLHKLVGVLAAPVRQTASVQERPPANCSYPLCWEAACSRTGSLCSLVSARLWNSPTWDIFLLAVANKIRSQAGLVTFWWSCSVWK